MEAARRDHSLEMEKQTLEKFVEEMKQELKLREDLAKLRYNFDFKEERHINSIVL